MSAALLRPLSGAEEKQPLESAGDNSLLTAVETKWILGHPVIRVGYDPAWPPFSITDKNGKFVGIDADVLELIGTRLGLHFEPVATSNWSESYRKALAGEIDILSGTAKTPERLLHFDFSNSYTNFPIAIITRNDAPFLWSAEDLNGKSVAAVKDYAPTQTLEETTSNVRFLWAPTVEAAMTLVSDSTADAVVTNLANASFIIKTRGLTNLKIAGLMRERLNLRFAVRQDWPELKDILNKGIASLTPADLQALDHRWIRVDYAKVIRWDVVWRASLVVLLVLGTVIGFFIFHNLRLGRELDQRIRLQREVEEAHAQLKLLHDDKDELLKMAAHDLRGPLTAIQLMLDSSSKLRVIPPADALAMIEPQIAQMVSLLSNLLDVQTIESGRRNLNLKVIDPGMILETVISSTAHNANHKHLRIDLSGAQQTTAIFADELALQQIMENLVSNAIKYSPLGASIEIVLDEWRGFIRFCISDHGAGVAASDRERIFTKYVRSIAVPTGGEKSTGLGLSIVRALVTAMNGRVWCESDVGKGATFIVLLPRAADRAIEKPV